MKEDIIVKMEKNHGLVEYYIDHEGYLNVYVFKCLAFKICQCGHMNKCEIETLIDELLQDAGFKLKGVSA